MAGWRRAVEVAMTNEEIERLTALSRSRTEPASLRAGIAGADAVGLSRESFVLCGGAKSVGVHHQRFQRCVERGDGLWAAGGHRGSTTAGQRTGQSRRRPKPGWCRWHATRPRSTAIRMSCGRRGFWRVTHASTDRTSGHECLARLVQGTVCKILGQEKSSRTRCALLSGTSRCRVRAEDGGGSVRLSARGDPGSEKSRRQSRAKPSSEWRSFSYDEKPGIQAIATTAPDLPPKPGVHATVARDYEYKRHGTLSLLAGIDLLLPGRSMRSSGDRHRSREFIEFSQASSTPLIRPAPSDQAFDPR